MFTKGFWKWVLVGGLVSSTFLGAKAQSIKELEKDCQSGNPNACAKLRYIYVEAGDTQKNRPKRADTETQYIKELEKACRKGDAKSCMELGDMYAEGKGVPQDYTKAITLYRKACAIGSIKNRQKVRRKSKEAPKYTYKYQSPAVDTKRQLERMVPVEEKKPESVQIVVIPSPVDNTSSTTLQHSMNTKELYEKACEMGDNMGCYKLGEMYYHGREAQQNYEKASEYYQKACRMGNSIACYRIGEMYYYGQVQNDDPHAMSEFFYQRACLMGNDVACYKLGDINYYSIQNLQKSMEYYQKACDFGNARGCYRVGMVQAEVINRESSYIKAIEFYQRACDLGNANACNDLGAI